jgi:sec-independent protein translocase protein TatB
MIDLGVSKLALIAVVALVVVGPERLPKIARMAGNLFGRAQRYMADVKSEVSRQMDVEEFKKLREESVSAFKDVENSIQSTAQ